MYNNKKLLAVITARIGSKRLVNKNILDLSGKPLIAWTIEEAKKSKYIDKLIISTDSEFIAKVAIEFNAEVPFIRPKELASDTSDSISVLKHSIDFFKDEYDYIMLLQPTSPLRSSEDIDAAIEMLSQQTQSIVSVTKTQHNPLWSNKLPEDLSMENFIQDEIKNKRSQDLPTYFRLNGSIYVSEIDYFLHNNGFFGHNTKAFIMSSENSIDIDTQLDFDFASYLINKRKF